jgi:hypothetical protein
MGLNLQFIRRLLSRSERAGGWLAISFLPGELCLAHVRRVPGGRPEVGLCAIEPISAASDPDALMGFAKGMRMERLLL